MPERLNSVTVTTRRGTLTIPWESRDALVDRLSSRSSARDIVDAFNAVGASRPVVLTNDQEERLLTDIEEWARDTGGNHKLPDGIWNLRNVLVDELHDTGRGP